MFTRITFALSFMAQLVLPALLGAQIPLPSTAQSYSANVTGAIEGVIFSSPELGDGDSGNVGGTNNYPLGIRYAGSLLEAAATNSMGSFESSSVNNASVSLQNGSHLYDAPFAGAATFQYATAQSTGADVWASWEALNQAWATYAIAQNASYPTAGQGTNSATLVAKLQFTVGEEISGAGSAVDTMTTLITAGVGNSFISVYPLDPAGETWAAIGQLSNTGSSYDLDPIDVSDSYLAYDEILYYGTQATQVNAQVTVYAIVQGTSWVWPEGSDDAQYQAHGSYTVTVP